MTQHICLGFGSPNEEPLEPQTTEFLSVDSLFRLLISMIISLDRYRCNVRTFILINIPIKLSTDKNSLDCGGS